MKKSVSPTLLVAAAAVAFWVWTCFCRYPVHGWNEIRLEPTFLWAAGLNPYPGPGEGPVTTWVYGPVPILLQLPAVLARSPAAAMIAASAINVLIAVLPLIWVVWRLRPAAALRSPKGEAGWAVLAALAAWPAVNLIFCQADNAALALGLIGIPLLADAGEKDGRRFWLAAAAAALALWSKQTELAPLLGQIAFVAMRFGIRPAMAHAARCVAVAAGAGVAFAGLFSADGLAYNMFVVPSGFPWLAPETKLADPLYASHAIGYLVAYVGGPLVLLLIRARTPVVTSPDGSAVAGLAEAGRPRSATAATTEKRPTTWNLFRREDPLLLPVLTFFFSIPFNLAGFLTIGGNVNSLHAAAYVLPAAAYWLAGRPRLRLATILAVLAIQASIQWPLTRTPAVEGLRQGVALAQQLRGEVYFPWDPLITYYVEKRFDHAEDGLLTRAVAGRPLTSEQLRAYLPPKMDFVAYRRFSIDGYVKQMIPANAQRVTFGEWILYSWQR